MEATQVDRSLSRLLEIKPGSAVLQIRRTTFSQLGQPFEHTFSVYRGDRYILHAVLLSETARQMMGGES
jgi:DNA-binding GntR family transcriptional regulator